MKDSDYPHGASARGAGGTVSVRYAVEPDGRVSGCRVIRSSGDPDLDTTTCRLIEKRFRFEPSRDGEGHPVRSLVEESHSWSVEPERLRER